MIFLRYRIAAIAVVAKVAFCADDDSSLRGSRLLHPLSVDSLELIDTKTSQVIAKLLDNAKIPVDKNGSFSINAVTSGPVGSVRFGLDGDDAFRIERFPVWALCGDKLDLFNPCESLSVGKHTVSATPMTFGRAGETKTLTFTLIDLSDPISAFHHTNTPSDGPVSVSDTNPMLLPPAIGQPEDSCRIPKFVGKWQSAPQYPIRLVQEAQGAIVGRDFIVVSGFIGGVRRATEKNYALNLDDSNATWRQIADLPVSPGITHGAFVVVGSKFYMCGGYLGGHPGPHIDTCLVYDHGLNRWEFFESLPQGRAGGGMIYDSTKNVLVFSAGAERPDPSNPHAEDYQHTWMYSLNNPEAGWIEKVDIPYLTNHMSYATAKDADGKERHFFLAGQVGENERTGNVDDNYEWDSVTERWTARKKMPFTRGHASSSTNAVNCGLMIAAGSTNEFGKTSYYDVPSNSWINVGLLPRALNTPVCDIDFVKGWYYCFTGVWQFATKIKIQL